jgi:hypothetical protein
MKKHPIRKLIELRATLPLQQAEALAAFLNGTAPEDSRVRGFRRHLNAALREVGRNLGRLEGRSAAAGR